MLYFSVLCISKRQSSWATNYTITIIITIITQVVNPIQPMSSACTLHVHSPQNYERPQSQHCRWIPGWGFFEFLGYYEIPELFNNHHQNCHHNQPQHHLVIRTWVIFRLGCSLKTEFMSAILAALLRASAFVGHVCKINFSDCCAVWQQFQGKSVHISQTSMVSSMWHKKQ